MRCEPRLTLLSWRPRSTASSRRSTAASPSCRCVPCANESTRRLFRSVWWQECRRCSASSRWPWRRSAFTASLAYVTAQRTGEIGIRMACSAPAASEVQRLVLRDTLTLVLIGVAIGLPAALAGARLLSSELVRGRSKRPTGNRAGPGDALADRVDRRLLSGAACGSGRSVHGAARGIRARVGIRHDFAPRAARRTTKARMIRRNNVSFSVLFVPSCLRAGRRPAVASGCRRLQAEGSGCGAICSCSRRRTCTR